MNAPVAPATLDTFKFMVDAIGEVTVMAIVQGERRNSQRASPPDSIAAASRAALWVAYVSSKDARNGITVAQGGAFDDGEWSDRSINLADYEDLFFMAISLDNGSIVGSTESIPFTIGNEPQKLGSPCDISGELCDSEEPLICFRGTCHRSCLSEFDCLALGTGASCFSEPKIRGTKLCQ